MTASADHKHLFYTAALEGRRSGRRGHLDRAVTSPERPFSSAPALRPHCFRVRPAGGGPMLTIGGRGLKGPTESAHTRPLQPFGLRSLSWSQSGSASPALVLVTVSSAPSRKSVVEKEVEGASGRDDGLSDGEFWGTNEAGLGGSLTWDVVG